MAESICEAILAPRWYVRPGVTRTVLPISAVLEAGAGHIEIPGELLKEFRYGGAAVEWLDRADDGESLGSDVAYEPVIPAAISALMRHIAAKVQNVPRLAPTGRASIKRIDWEWNNWHYDTCPGLTDESSYNVPGAVKAEARAAYIRQEHYLLVTLPFPIEGQGPTVVAPWGGVYCGDQVQCPSGYATVFNKQCAWHRGDRWRGSRRGVFLYGITVSALQPQDSL